MNMSSAILFPAVLGLDELLKLDYKCDQTEVNLSPDISSIPAPSTNRFTVSSSRLSLIDESYSGDLEVKLSCDNTFSINEAILESIINRKEVIHSYKYDYRICNVYYLVQKILQECNEYGWDGHGSEPIDKESSYYAIEFIKVLPHNMSSPELVPNPAGQLDLMWWDKNDRIGLTLSINNNGMGSFGFINKDAEDECFGSFKFKEEIPESLIPYFKYF